MGLWDTVEFAHMALRLVPEILDPIDVVLLVGEQLRVVDPEVMEVRHIKHVERLWRREGLKVPMKQPKKGRL